MYAFRLDDLPLMSGDGFGIAMADSLGGMLFTELELRAIVSSRGGCVVAFVGRGKTPANPQDMRRKRIHLEWTLDVTEDDVPCVGRWDGVESAVADEEATALFLFASIRAIALIAVAAAASVEIEKDLQHRKLKARCRASNARSATPSAAVVCPSGARFVISGDSSDEECGDADAGATVGGSVAASDDSEEEIPLPHIFGETKTTTLIEPGPPMSSPRPPQGPTRWGNTIHREILAMDSALGELGLSGAPSRSPPPRSPSNAAGVPARYLAASTPAPNRTGLVAVLAASILSAASFAVLSSGAFVHDRHSLLVFLPVYAVGLFGLLLFGPIFGVLDNFILYNGARHADLYSAALVAGAILSVVAAWLFECCELGLHTPRVSFPAPAPVGRAVACAVAFFAPMLGAAAWACSSVACVLSRDAGRWGGANKHARLKETSSELEEPVRERRIVGIPFRVYVHAAAICGILANFSGGGGGVVAAMTSPRAIFYTIAGSVCEVGVALWVFASFAHRVASLYASGYDANPVESGFLMAPMMAAMTMAMATHEGGGVLTFVAGRGGAMFLASASVSTAHAISLGRSRRL